MAMRAAMVQDAVAVVGGALEPTVVLAGWTALGVANDVVDVTARHRLVAS